MMVAFKMIRYRIARFIARDWIEDLEKRLSTLLCEVTGGRCSKAYYTIETMMCEVRDYNHRICEKCQSWTGLQDMVAMEIFAEIETVLNLNKVYADSGIYFESDIETDIADLKKKYTGEQK